MSLVQIFEFEFLCFHQFFIHQSNVQNFFVQRTFVRSFVLDISQSCPSVHVQSFVLCSDFRVFTFEFSCFHLFFIHQNLVQTRTFEAFLFRLSRLSFCAFISFSFSDFRIRSNVLSFVAFLFLTFKCAFISSFNVCEFLCFHQFFIHQSILFRFSFVQGPSCVLVLTFERLRSNFLFFIHQSIFFVRNFERLSNVFTFVLSSSFSFVSQSVPELSFDQRTFVRSFLSVHV